MMFYCEVSAWSAWEATPPGRPTLLSDDLPKMQDHDGQGIQGRRFTMGKEMDSCVKPAAGPLVKAPAPTTGAVAPKEEVKMTLARVGKEAPDFEATAFIAGEGFKNVRLSSYRGKWVVLCFYPGDFTFV